MKRLCQLFRSPKKAEMYLYVDKARGLEDVPEPLLAQFGEPEAFMMIMLTAEKKLARADASQVLAQIEEKGFYLQMPPTTAELLRREGNDS